MRSAIGSVAGLLCLSPMVFAGCGGPGGSAASITPSTASVGTRSAVSTARVAVDRPTARGCATRTVFVRLDTEIRGYPLDARGATQPCAIIAGPLTQLVERGALAVSVHGLLHSLSFQSDFGLTLDPATANGNVPPSRTVRLNQDHVALAVDSLINDFVVASEAYAGDNCWYVVANHQTTATAQNCDLQLAAIHTLTTDDRDELYVIGIDAVSRRTRIDLYAGPATATPRLVRTIEGPATGLPELSGSQGYFDVSFSLATDPRSGDLYVFSHLFNSGGGGAIAGAPEASVTQFAADAAGDATPRRVLGGPDANFVQASFSVNVLGVDDRGKLYIVSPGPRPTISVFGSRARGNAAPERTFYDPAASVGFEGASVGVRSVIR